MAAGKYHVVQQDSLTLFQLYAATGKSVFLSAAVQKKGDPANPKLTFACYGHECLLSQVSLPGNDVAYAVSQSSLDKQLTRKIGVAAMISVPLTHR